MFPATQQLYRNCNISNLAHHSSFESRFRVQPELVRRPVHVNAIADSVPRPACNRPIVECRRLTSRILRRQEFEYARERCLSRLLYHPVLVKPSLPRRHESIVPRMAALVASATSKVKSA
jgi:hypothetical protein